MNNFKTKARFIDMGTPKMYKKAKLILKKL